MTKFDHIMLSTILGSLGVLVMYCLVCFIRYFGGF